MSDEQVQPKRRRRGRPRKAAEQAQAGPISVSITLKSGEKFTFNCFQQYQDGPFLTFLSPGLEGRVLRRNVAVDSVAMVSIEEYPMQYRATQAQPAFSVAPAPAPAPVMVSQNTAPTELSLSPGMLAKKGLRTGVSKEGLPLSELPDGSIVPAGFMS